MIVESLAIIALIFAMAFVFLRAKKTVYAYGILPLLLLPVMHIFLDYISDFFSKLIPAELQSIKICIIFVSLIAACIMIGLLGGGLKKKGSKTVYLIICGLFTLVLAMFYVIDILKVVA